MRCARLVSCARNLNRVGVHENCVAVTEPYNVFVVRSRAELLLIHRQSGACETPDPLWDGTPCLAVDGKSLHPHVQTLERPRKCRQTILQTLQARRSASLGKAWSNRQARLHVPWTKRVVVPTQRHAFAVHLFEIAGLSFPPSLHFLQNCTAENKKEAR